MTKNSVWALMAFALLGGLAAAADLDFLERFALADDRAEVLKELIPGTEDYYYFHCLYYQQAGRFEDVDALLETWAERYGQTPALTEIRHRQTLLLYSSDPGRTLEYLKRVLDLNFNQQRELPGEAPDLPSRLDPKLTSRTTLLERALDDAQYADTVDGFTRHAYDWLLAVDLSETRLRSLLQSLDLPDYGNLPALVAKDLKAPHSGGFGTLPIHTQMVREQLDELLVLIPDLLNNDAFITTYLRRLHPGADEPDWRMQPEVREAYLERLATFAGRLTPAQNSLKAHILYHRLGNDMAQGTYDKERFLEYLRLPREFDYVNPDYLRSPDGIHIVRDLSGEFLGATGLEPLGSDEALVRQYLMHFFESGDDYAEFARFIREDYLRRLFAETKLLQGDGDLEQWYSWLDPVIVDALKKRTDVEFTPGNKVRFAPGEEVSLELWIKNVDRLLVKVFEIDAENYYRQFNREINTDIDLDGLIPNYEEVHTYTEAPLLRVKRQYAFPQLKDRGSWVIEFVGNGKSSRAIVEKGRLQYLSRTGTAGQMITVLDETGRKLPGASVWFSGKTYTADPNGEIALPFSTDAGPKPFVLCDAGFATLDTFQHEAEDYRLVAGFHVDAESLRPGMTAKVAIRPLLYLNGAQIPVGLIKDPVLTLTSTTGDGITSTQHVREFPLHAGELSIHSFRVPENLAEIRFELSGSIDRLTNPEPVRLNAQHAFPVNGINATEQIASLFLSRVADNYIFEARDKTGMAVSGKVVYLNLSHVDFTESVRVELKTDADGRIALGSLQDIQRVSATAEGLNEQSWDLTQRECNYPNVLHGDARGILRVPFTKPAQEPEDQFATLLELRGGEYVADRTGALRVSDGYVTATGLPRGDYLLHLKPTDRRIYIRLTEGSDEPYFLASESRALEIDQPTPLQVQSVDGDAESIRVRIENANDFTRVHVVASCYQPDFRLFDLLNVMQYFAPDAKAINGGFALYQSGRDIGDEFRYILERRFAAKYPGNMLDRPSLLLNPWAVQETQAEQEPPAAAEPPAPAPPPPMAMERQREETAGTDETVPAPPFSPSYDFLGGDSAVFYNLTPDSDGVVTIPRKDLQGRQYLQIVATDPFSIISKDVALPERDVPLRDLRLAKALDPAGHFVEQKRIRVLDSGESLRVSLTGEAIVQTYDSIPAVYGLFATLNNDPRLKEFNFVARWPKLTPEEKYDLFSEYESHELNSFLYHKDKEFFESTVRPFLENKSQKTFFDHWLLGNDLGVYLQPWQYGQLNLIEKILLAKRVLDELPHTQGYVRDVLDLIPPNPERRNALFMTALYGGALQQGTGGGLQNAQVGGEIRVRANYFADVSGDGVVNGGFGGGGLGAAPSDAKGAPVLDDFSARPEGVSAGAGESLESLGYVEQRTRLHVAADFDRDLRESYRALYQAVEKTREWVETNYYKLPAQLQTPAMIPVSAFWRDYAETGAGQPFRSVHLTEAANSFSEILLALSVLDIPFEPSEHKTETGDTHYTIEAASPVFVFYKDIEPAQAGNTDTPILVSQNYFRLDERYRFEGNQRYDRFVKDEFLSGVVYGCQVTVTNPTSTPHEIEVLRQVPAGAIPVAGGRYTKSERMRLEPYSTVAIEYHFYFPEPGAFDHYPVHVSEGGTLLAFVEPHHMSVVEVPSSVDTTSWQYVSQQGSDEDVLEFLRTHNLNRVDLSWIAWRMRDRAFYDQALAVVRQRHLYEPVLWSFAVHHNDAVGIAAYLQYRGDFVAGAGPCLESPLLTIDPVERKVYQHIEYAPLINPRVHNLNRMWTITNDQFRNQYTSLMNVLAHCTALDQQDLMAVTYYMLLQDRVEDALRFFGRVTADSLETRIQYDYFKTYLALCQEDIESARLIAAQYADYPVERWRDLFRDVSAQIAEIKGAAGTEGDERAKQDRLAAEAPRLDLEVKEDLIVLYYRNIEECQLSFYPIDLEMLFTRNPFAPAQSNLFAAVKPAAAQTVRFDTSESQSVVPLPEDFANRHVVIEAEVAGISRTSIRYASSLVAQLIESYGQVQVADKATQTPLAKIYAKVFARMQNGETVFYKDGYTDLRGRFDYASSSTLDVGSVNEFAILIIDEERGARMLTAGPPGR